MVIKISFQKLIPKVINYKNCNKFCNALFWEELAATFSEATLEEGSVGRLSEIFNVVLDRHGSCKNVCPKKKLSL